jgi:hypothetical protein
MQLMNRINERADREAQLGIEPRFCDALRDLLGDLSRRGIFTVRVGYSTEQAPPTPGGEGRGDELTVLPATSATRTPSGSPV